MAALAPQLRSVTRSPEIVPLHYADFRFPDPALDHRRGVVMGYAIRHARGVVLFDTGFGFGNAELDARYRIEARRIEDVFAEAGLRLDDVIAVANCHLHVDHAGQNSALPGIPIHVQPREWEIAHTTEHTILEWIDFPGARYERIAGDHDIVEGIRVVDTPGHTAGHQSLAVATDEGLVVLAGQAVYTVEEWQGRPDELDGRPNAPLAEAYDASLERLRDLEPAAVLFGHDRRAWTRTTQPG
jgi:glyoxylase-like metal-dependent hydrolase (beta-lactamase superfamily II)